MGEKTFRARVRDTVIREAQNYKTTYVDFEYLLLVNKSKRKFCVITGTPKNYLHLTGVHTNLTPQIFFEKCVKEKLDDCDLDFTDDEGRDIKGTVRRKITVLYNMNNLMNKKVLFVQDGFKKNNIVCTVGTTDSICTVGFISSSVRNLPKAFPKTLLKGNELKSAEKVELLLKRKKGNEKFDNVLIGNGSIIRENFEELKEIITVDLYAGIRENKKSRVMKLHKKIKTPVCFQQNTYVGKLKLMKLKNKR